MLAKTFAVPVLALVVCLNNVTASPAWRVSGSGIEVSYDASSGSTRYDEECFTDGYGNYANNERATITANRAGTVNRRGSFRMESTSYDYLTIKGSKYGGTSPPATFTVTAGEKIYWRTDGSTVYSGFTLCMVPTSPTQLPTQAPTALPTAPTIAPTGTPTVSPTAPPTMPASEWALPAWIVPTQCTTNTMDMFSGDSNCAPTLLDNNEVTRFNLPTLAAQEVLSQFSDNRTAFTTRHTDTLAISLADFVRVEKIEVCSSLASDADANTAFDTVIFTPIGDVRAFSSNVLNSTTQQASAVAARRSTIAQRSASSNCAVVTFEGNHRIILDKFSLGFTVKFVAEAPIDFVNIVSVRVFAGRRGEVSGACVSDGIDPGSWMALCLVGAVIVSTFIVAALLVIRVVVFFVWKAMSEEIDADCAHTVDLGVLRPRRIEGCVIITRVGIAIVAIFNAVGTTALFTKLTKPMHDSFMQIWNSQRSDMNAEQPCAVLSPLFIEVLQVDGRTCGNVEVCSTFALATSLKFSPWGVEIGDCPCLEGRCNSVSEVKRSLDGFLKFSEADCVTNWVEIALIVVMLGTGLFRALLSFSLPKATTEARPSPPANPFHIHANLENIMLYHAPGNGRETRISLLPP